MLKFTTTGIMCRDCHAAERGEMWKCPTCDHVMTEEQSKGYRGCPAGFHPVQHVQTKAGVVLMQDGMSFDHFEALNVVREPSRTHDVKQPET